MFSLEALIRPEALRAAVDEVEPLFGTALVHPRQRAQHLLRRRHRRPGRRPSGVEQGHDSEPHDLRRPDSGQHDRAGLRMAAAHRLPGCGVGEAAALPDGRPPWPDQRHGLSGGGAAQLALRPGRVHHHHPHAGAALGRGVPVPQRAQKRLRSELRRRRAPPGWRRRARADPAAGAGYAQRLQGQEHGAPGDAGRRRASEDHRRLLLLRDPGRRTFSDTERLGFYGRTDPVPDTPQFRA